GVLAGVYLHAKCFDLAPEQARTTFVQLHRHQARREFHHVGFQTHATQGVGSLEAQKTTTDHDADAALAAAHLDAAEVVDGPVDEAMLAVLSGDGRHKGIRAGSQHQLVPGCDAAGCGAHSATGNVDRHHGVAEHEVHVVVAVVLARGQREIGGRGTGEVGTEVHPVVGKPRLVGERGDGVVTRLPGCQEIVDEAMADHTIADHY